jgi:2-(1,2-epoxy-1,2-dihydrophenyl)acetyl-CoA isomerase
MSYETIIYQETDNIAQITLNRLEVLNALNDQMLKELPEAVTKASRDENVRVLIITGSGRAFCSGGDRKFLENLKADEPFREEMHQVILGLRRMGKPAIAMVNGPAVGGGFDLALACDMRIGSESARFSVAFTKVGLTPGTATAWVLPRIVGMSKALRLLFTGDPVDAEKAYRMGLLDELVPAESLEGETMALARRLAQGPPTAIAFDKMIAYRSLDMDFETALALSVACVRVCFGTQDFREGLKAAAEKRQPVFTGR